MKYKNESLISNSLISVKTIQEAIVNLSKCMIFRRKCEVYRLHIAKESEQRQEKKLDAILQKVDLSYILLSADLRLR